jgi:DNA-binding transcriptional regulator of glucitol operon
MATINLEEAVVGVAVESANQFLQAGILGTALAICGISIAFLVWWLLTTHQKTMEIMRADQRVETDNLIGAIERQAQHNIELADKQQVRLERLLSDHTIAFKEVAVALESVKGQMGICGYRHS